MRRAGPRPRAPKPRGGASRAPRAKVVEWEPIDISDLVYERMQVPRRDTCREQCVRVFLVCRRRALHLPLSALGLVVVVHFGIELLYDVSFFLCHSQELRYKNDDI